MSKKLIAGLFMLGAGSAWAELTLSNALAIARAENPELRAARLRVEAVTGRALQTRAWPNPELELSAEDMPANHVGPARAKNMVGLSQTIPFPGKKAFDLQIGQREITGAELEYRQRERAVSRAVKAAFYRRLAAEQKITAAEQLREWAQTLVAAAENRIAAGAAGNQERLRAEIELEHARLEVAAARRESAEAQRELTALLGQPVGAVTGELRATAPVVTLTAHPVLQAAQVERDRAELEWRRARLDAWPDVTVGVAGGRDAAAKENLLEFRVSLPLPVFDRGQGRQREARALAEIARQDVTATTRRLTQEFAAAQGRVETAAERAAAYRERIVPKAEEALRLGQAGFAAGKFTFLELVDAQRTVAEARLGYLDQLLELNLALAELESFSETQP